MKKETGFTLIELLIGIAVLAVLLGIGVPSFQEMIRTNRVAAITNDLVAAIQFGRSEAVRLGGNVEVCSSNDQATCSGNWNDGWIVRNAAGVIRVWPPLRANANVAPTVPGTVEFRALGDVVVPRCVNIQFDGLTRSVEVGLAGRVRTSAAANCV